MRKKNVYSQFFNVFYSFKSQFERESNFYCRYASRNIISAYKAFASVRLISFIYRRYLFEDLYITKLMYLWHRCIMIFKMPITLSPSKLYLPIFHPNSICIHLAKGKINITIGILFNIIFSSIKILIIWTTRWLFMESFSNFDVF